MYCACFFLERMPATTMTVAANFTLWGKMSVSTTELTKAEVSGVW